MIERLKSLPVLRGVRRARAERHFWRSKYVSHWGVFDTFAAADAAIPAELRVGWDHAEPAALFANEKGVNPRDYPVLYWLNTLWSERPLRVFDHGGHVGGKRYAFEPYLAFDADVHWTICDVPAVVEAGRRLAAERKPVNLGFTSDFAEASGCDVLLALGVLQYIERDFDAQLAALERLPAHIIVNGTPLHASTSYVTIVNNAGASFSPYRIRSAPGFIAGLERLGYELVDQWRIPEKRCLIPLRPELDVRQYSGFYFRLR